MYTGENRNGSNLSHTVVDNAIPTLYNVPIVCNWDPDKREIGGHDFDVVTDEEGKIHLRTLTEPCGVITDHTKISFQIKEDEDGVEHEYLVADGVVLWKRQDVYDYIVNDCEGIIPHSMEINVLDGEMNKKTSCYDVKSFEFTALCLLGNASPCFESSKLEMYSKQSIKDSVAEMMAELQECYSLIATAEAEGNTTNSTEGGDKMSDEIKQIVESFGYDVDNLDFSIEGMTADEVRAKFEAMKSNNSEDAKADDTTDAGQMATPESGDPENFELNSNLRDRIREAIAQEKIVYEWGGSDARYYLCDYDTDKAEIYVEDRKESYHLYSVKYTVDNDTISIDWSTKTRKKYAIVDFVEGDEVFASNAAAIFEFMSDAISSIAAEKSEIEAKLSDITDKFSEATSELDTLRQFKADTEAAKLSEKIEAVFGAFSDLSGNEMFENLRTQISEGKLTVDPDALEEKCFAIKGRLGARANFSEVTKTTKIGVEHNTNDDIDDKPYGGIVEKYQNM